MTKFDEVCFQLPRLFYEVLETDLNLPEDYCTFTICKPLDLIDDYYLHSAINNTKNKDTKEDIYEICDILDNAENSVMFSCCDKTKDGYARRIFCPEVSILKLLIGCFDIDINDILDYFTEVIRHELGHFLYKDYLYETKGYEKGYKYDIRLNSKCQKAYIKYCKELDSQKLPKVKYIKMATTYYSNLEIEAKANEYGKVNTKLLNKLQVKLMSKI